MIPELPFVNSQRSQRRRCIVSHGGLTYGLVLWFLVVPIEPDRGHRLEMCENYVTSSATAHERAKNSLHYAPVSVFSIAGAIPTKIPFYCRILIQRNLSGWVRTDHRKS